MANYNGSLTQPYNERCHMSLSEALAQAPEEIGGDVWTAADDVAYEAQEIAKKAIQGGTYGGMTPAEVLAQRDRYNEIVGD